MNIKGFDHMNLTVKDFDETVDWYRRVFNFELVERDVTEGVLWGILRSEGGEGDAMLCIYQYPDRKFLDRHELKRRDIHGISHWGFRINDEEKWKETLDREGLTYITYDNPFSKAWYVQDPTGYEIEVALWENDQVRFHPMKVTHA